MKKTISTILFISLFSILFAQKQEKRPFQIKWNFSTLANYMPSIQGGVQYQLFDKFHLQHEVGFISGAFSPFWDLEDKLFGLRVNNTLKYYVSTFSSKVPLYFGLDIFYRRNSYQTQWLYSMYDESYFEIISRNRKKQVIAGSLILGFEPYISESVFLEFYGGLGIRQLIIKDQAIPEYAKISGSTLFRQSEGTYFFPNITMGIRIGFVLYQNKGN
ncbi:MAG: hypothetical protein PHY85_08495 [Bacteroidales bacterium]|nr:hypothetical protein [Bacteroidales bacterium]